MSRSGRYKIVLAGGDDRQYYMAKEFISRGYSSQIWNCSCNADSNIFTSSLDDLIKDSDAVVLPLPLSRDKENLNCKSGEVRLSDIFSAIPSGMPTLCGSSNQFYYKLAKEHGITLYDYFDDEGVMIKNAWLTAEGAMEILIRELPISIRNSHFAVFGFGRVGSAISSALKALGGDVCVFARSSRDLATAAVSGCNAVPIVKASGNATQFNAVINTIPSYLFDQKMLSALNIDNLFLDLASGNTFDIEAAKTLGIRAVKALSLPGKTSPLSAAQILCDSVLDILNREGYLV